MAEEMSIRDFYERFPNETACWQHLRTHRWGEEGFECPRCGETDHWGLIKTRRLFECYECGKQTSVTAGTILQDTKLDLQTWFLAAYLILTWKKGISTPELARKTGISERSAWFVLHRITHVLGQATAEDLFGVVEADETFLGGKGEPEGGRPANQATVLGAVERREGRLGRLRLSVVPDRSGETFNTTLQPGLRPGTSLWTDGWAGYQSVQDVDHWPISDAQATAPGHQIPAIHVVFANLKSVMKGVHGWCSRAKLQVFLDLFAYRFNHRDDLDAGVEQALGLLATTKPIGCQRLVGGNN